MRPTVELNIEYYGHYEKVVGKKQEQIKISTTFHEGIHDIKKYLEESYSINNGFMMMINNENVIKLLKKSEHIHFSEKDIIKIIPIFSGG